ncbi:MAG: EAL domain-containing protein [Velocimicrobium sp.]
MQQNKNKNTEIDRLKQELFKEREKFSLFLSLNTNCFFEYDEQTQSIFFAKNENFSKLDRLVIELEKEKFIKKTGIFYADYEQFIAIIKSKQDSEKEIRFLSNAGDYIWCRVKTAVINQLNGMRHIIGCINDDDDNHKKIEWLKEQSQLDTLTRFYNKHYMKEYTELFLSTDQQMQEGCLFLIDIDNFKRVNNNMGRLFSDTVLTNIAESIRRTMPENSIFGRIVDDKFAVFVKNMSEKEDVMLLIRQLNAVLEKTYAGGTGNNKISCCMGIARYPMNSRAYDELFMMADASLFYAKAKGYGRAQLFDSNNIEIVPDRAMEDMNPKDIKQIGKMKYKDGFAENIGIYAQDLMSTTKDVYSAIHLLLEKLAREYHATSVEIYEKEKGRKVVTLTYGYNALNRQQEDIVKEFDYKEFIKNKTYFDQNGLSLIINKEQSILQCAFYEDGLFKGIICAVDAKNSNRVWTQEEKDGIVSVTRVLSFHILRLKVTEKIQEQIDHMKNYDALTGMPTLHKFKKDAVALLKKGTTKYAVVYSDIGNFKYINDVYGYQFGDRILYDFALELVKVFPKKSIFGRVSADNYVVLVPYEQREEIETMVLSLSQNFHNVQKEKHVATNIIVISGVYFLKQKETDISIAIDNANVARKNAKLNSFSTWKFYNDKMEEKIRKEQEISNEMEDALINGEFIVFLQPKVELQNEKLAGAEALVRWKKGDGRIIPPDEFIPLFEKNGFILQLDFFVYEEVCKIIQKWMLQGKKVIPISVNVSRIHLNDGYFVKRIKNLVDKYNIPPNYMELELTESVFVSDTKNTINVMKELRTYGFSVSIDDFGAGYSSLTLLKDMATDVIKLDKEFFSHGEMKKEEQIIVSSIISMAKQLDMKVISEGIETKTQTQFLKDISCDMVQGYYYAKPMPLDQFEEFVVVCGGF